MVSEIKEPKVATYKNKHNKGYTKLAEFQHYDTRLFVTPPRTQNGLDRRCLTTQEIHRLEARGTVNLRNSLIKHKGHKD